jgi:hypothetical protein
LSSSVLIYLQGCEREVAEAQKGSSDELLSECIMRLSWALVHSRRPEDVQRGIAMLEGGNIYKTRLLCVCVCVCVCPSPPLGPLNQEVCPAEMALSI